MYTILPVLRSSKKRGSVLIRLYSRRATVYFQTAIVASESDLLHNRVDLSREIRELRDKIEALPNFLDLDARQIKALISDTTAGDLSFNRFALEYLAELEKRGGKRTDVMYLAVKSFRKSLRKTNPSFADFTVRNLQKWYDDLASYRRTRTLYPFYVRKIYEAGMRRFNDPDSGRMIIKPYPAEYLFVSKGPARRRRPSENALSIPDLRKLILADLDAIPLRGRKERREARAVCLLSFILAGINVKDLFELREENIRDGKLGYCRAKVRDRRDDGGYIEFRLPKEAFPYITILQEGKESGMLLNLSARHADHRKASRHLIKTFRTISKSLSLPRITPYIFRYTFASIARNDCHVPMEDLAFALNHVAIDRVTDGYVKKDFSRIDRVIEAVLAKVFGK